MPLHGTRGAASALGFGFAGGGAAIPGIYTTPLLSGTVILNGWGLMIYQTGFSDQGSTPTDASAIATASFVVPTLCTKIRVVCIGGGGGASGAENIISGQGGGGVEAFITVTAGETLTVGVGKGGVGNFSSNPGSGGDSYIKRSGTDLVRAYGGLPATATANTRVSGLITTGTTISIGYGGTSGNYGGSAPAADQQTLSLSGATAHGGGSAQINGGAPSATGLGFGGGGGQQATDDPANRWAGGVYGYSGGNGTNTGGNAGLGPVGGWANDFNTNGAGTGRNSGGAGGSFGGAGSDYYSGGYGAGGLVRIWWASNAGDSTYINSGGNYG